MTEEYEYTLKGKIKAEVDKIKSMDKKKRLNYLKSYYLGPFLIILFLIICFIWLLSDTVFSRMEPIYSGGMVNCNIPEDKLEMMENDFFEILGGNPKKEEVVISNDFYLTFAEEEQNSELQMEMSLFTLMAAGEFDFLIFDSLSIGKFQSEDTFKDISKLTTELNIDEDLYYYNEQKIPTALKLPESVREKYQLTGYNADVYIAFVDLGRYNDKDIEFLNYLFK